MKVCAYWDHYSKQITQIQEDIFDHIYCGFVLKGEIRIETEELWKIKDGRWHGQGDKEIWMCQLVL